MMKKGREEEEEEEEKKKEGKLSSYACLKNFFLAEHK